jgi:ABC-type nitrate/sulfonate/bicarbonate transport system ATPase subunit
MIFKVVGKTTIRNKILLAPLGVYGHTVTAANIIAGLFRHGMDDSDFMEENMNVPRKRNKALVQTQAWTPYKNFFPNMAFQQYQLAANMTEDSIRSIHLCS